MAAPFLSGKYSKDLILEILCVPHNFSHTIAYILTLFGALLTCSYSIRVFMKVFLSSPNYPRTFVSYIADSGNLMTIPLLILCFVAVFLGYLTNELLLGVGSEYFSNSIFIHPDNLRILDATNSGSDLALIPLLFLLLILSLLIIKPNNNNSYNFTNLNRKSYKSLNNTNITNISHNISYESKFSNLRALENQNIFNYWIKHYILILANNLYRNIDRGILEIFGPLGFIRFFNWIGFKVELISTGYILHYILLIVFVLISITLILLSSIINIKYLILFSFFLYCFLTI